MPPIAGSLTLAMKAIRETTQISMCVCVWGGEGRKDGSGGEGRLRLGWKKEGRGWECLFALLVQVHAQYTPTKLHAGTNCSHCT